MVVVCCGDFDNSTKILPHLCWGARVRLVTRSQLELSFVVTNFKITIITRHSVIHLPVRVCPPSVESPLISHSKSVSIATDLRGSL